MLQKKSYLYELDQKTTVFSQKTHKIDFHIHQTYSHKIVSSEFVANQTLICTSEAIIWVSADWQSYNWSYSGWWSFQGNFCNQENTIQKARSIS